MLAFDQPYANRVRVSWEPDGRRRPMKLAGVVDYNAVATLHDADIYAMSSPGCNRLMGDISEVTFLDSERMGALVKLRDMTTQKTSHWSSSILPISAAAAGTQRDGAGLHHRAGL